MRFTLVTCLLAGCVHQYPYVAAVYQDGPQLYVKICNVGVASGRVHDIETGCQIEAVGAPPSAAAPQAANPAHDRELVSAQ
jgi:hypothetical protein